MTVLFVCSANTCRSVMCEYYFNHLAEQNPGCGWHSSSAGLCAYADDGASMFAVEMLDTLGINARNHTARPMTADLAKNADRIVAMTPSHLSEMQQKYPWAVEKMSLLLDETAGRRGGSVTDPCGRGLGFYGDIFGTLRTAVDAMFDRLTKTTLNGKSANQ